MSNASSLQSGSDDFLGHGPARNIAFLSSDRSVNSEVLDFLGVNIVYFLSGFFSENLFIFWYSI